MTDTDAARIARMNEFAQRVSASDAQATYPTLRPKDAATLILIDRSDRLPKVLLGKRHERHKFMPGKFVFPGGGVDASDKRMPVATPLEPHTEARLLRRFHHGSPVRARALALAAIRETFEETGLLLGIRSEASNVPNGPWAAFAREKILPICVHCTSSAVPSRRRVGHDALMRASSPWMPARSRTASTASPVRTQN